MTQTPAFDRAHPPVLPRREELLPDLQEEKPPSSQTLALDEELPWGECPICDYPLSAFEGVVETCPNCQLVWK